MPAPFFRVVRPSPTRQKSVRAKERLTLRQQRSRLAWFLIAPFLVPLALVVAWPLLRTFFYSFTDARLDFPDEYIWVGLDNYFGWSNGEAAGILSDPMWWKAVGNTLRFTVFAVPLELTCGMLLALLMHQKFPGRSLVRTAILIPWAIPGMISGKMWGWMFHDQYGIINDLLMRMGILDKPLAWIADSDLSLWTVVLVSTWRAVPFVALMFLSALQMIPYELYEAAAIDGIGPWQRFRRITLPLIAPAVIVTLIFRIMDGLRVFDLIYILTSGSEATISISGYARDQLVEYMDMGAGSAASVLVFALIAGISASVLSAGRFSKDENAESESPKKGGI